MHDGRLQSSGFAEDGTSPDCSSPDCQREGVPVLYVHGATFPSALSVAYRFGGRSWMDDLAACGFDVWAVDFAGYGGSDRIPKCQAASMVRPLGRVRRAAGQIARAVTYILGQTAKPRISLIAHSWGTMAAGLYASLHPEALRAFACSVRSRSATNAEKSTNHCCAGACDRRTAARAVHRGRSARSLACADRTGA